MQKHVFTIVFIWKLFVNKSVYMDVKLGLLCVNITHLIWNYVSQNSLSHVLPAWDCHERNLCKIWKVKNETAAVFILGSLYRARHSCRSCRLLSINWLMLLVCGSRSSSFFWVTLSCSFDYWDS